jgi:putative methyltransferase (TIGR04325 family)
LKKIKTFLKLLIPPFVLKLLNFYKRKNIQFQKTSLSWDDAYKKTSKGYSAENILIKCRDSLLKVKNGEYPYERDSVLFTEKEMFYPLLASLLYVSLENNKHLNIIDFGGSLGSTYFQNKDILKQIGIEINWNIIEQEKFVKCGKEYFADNELKFYFNIDEVINEKSKVDVCLLSSVLPYLKKPYAVFETTKRNNIKYIIIDRTFFLENEYEDILTIQKVPPEIYNASYPAWFFSLDKFISNINKYYDIILKWQAYDQHQLEKHKTIGLGFLLKNK